MEIFAAGVSSLTDLPNKGDTHGRLSDPDKADSRIGDTTRERNESRSGLVQPESYFYEHIKARAFAALCGKPLQPIGYI
jgi:hypothetical protein